MSGFFLSSNADEDLQGIFIFTDNSWGERQARKYLAGLFDAFDLIGRNPEMGRLRLELGDDIRSLPHGSHLIFFMPWEGETAIIRVLHGAMDIDDQFDGFDPKSVERSPR